MTRQPLAFLGVALLTAGMAGAQTARPVEEKKPEQEVVKRDEVVVVTASKVQTELINAPATMSVVSASTIASSHAENMGDLLRSVLGLNVVQLSARDINITSRQATSVAANSQLALLDGRSIYLDFFGVILWDFVPSSPSEIKQIEVVRGPASAVWGANALTGVVNIITKSPREAEGMELTLTGGLFDRTGGSRERDGDGLAYGASLSYAKAISDRVAFKISAGDYNSDPYSRPVGNVPVGTHPLDPSRKTGGAMLPIDEGGPVTGRSFENKGTHQPKLDLRLDHDFSGGASFSYAAGFAGTQGIIHTGIGPFRIESPSSLGYGKITFRKGELKVNVFTNVLDAKASNLLIADASGNPVRLDFTTQTYDFEIGHSRVLGKHHILTYGGNARKNNFDISLTPNAKDRTELGAYFQEEFFYGKFRLSAGARVDKFGNLDTPFASPRLTAMFKPAPDHAFRVSFSRAFRSPSLINNFLDQQIIGGVLDLRSAAPQLPASVRPLIARPYPIVVNNVGNPDLRAQSLNAYEIAYTAGFGKRNRTTFGVAAYQNDVNDDIKFTRLAPGLPGFVAYSAQDPPPGVPPAVMQILAQLPLAAEKKIIPTVASKYLNLSGLRQRGVEVSLDQSIAGQLSVFANYSFQSDPRKVDAKPGQIAYPIGEISIAPRSRYNAGISWNTRRLLGSASVNHADTAFWTGVLDPSYDGYSPAYTMLNASVGVKLAGGRITTSLKGTNLTNEKVQQHIFGDVLKRALFAEVRLSVK